AHAASRSSTSRRNAPSRSSAPVRPRSPSGDSDASSSPSRSRRTRSQLAASSNTWLETNRVDPDATRLWKMSQRWTRSRGSSPTVGSSSTSSGGSVESALGRGGGGGGRAGVCVPERARDRRQFDRLDYRRDSVTGDSEDAGEVPQILLHGQVAVHRGCLGHVSDPWAE